MQKKQYGRNFNRILLSRCKSGDWDVEERTLVTRKHEFDNLDELLLLGILQLQDYQGFDEKVLEKIYSITFIQVENFRLNPDRRS